jgi:hypothetical protein
MMQREIEKSIKSRIMDSLTNARRILRELHNPNSERMKNVIFDVSLEIERAVFFMLLLCDIKKIGMINYTPFLEKGNNIDLVKELNKDIDKIIEEISNGATEREETINHLLRIRELSYHLYKKYL